MRSSIKIMVALVLAALSAQATLAAPIESASVGTAAAEEAQRQIAAEQAERQIAAEKAQRNPGPLGRSIAFIKNNPGYIVTGVGAGVGGYLLGAHHQSNKDNSIIGTSS